MINILLGIMFGGLIADAIISRMTIKELKAYEKSFHALYDELLKLNKDLQGNYDALAKAYYNKGKQ